MKEVRLIRKEDLKAKENIILDLDSYGDIFSDFDLRDYSVKALSDDFLSECKKASLDKEDNVKLILVLGKSKRNVKEEIKIKKRLKEHFIKHFHKNKKEINRVRNQGFIWFLIGTMLMFVATFVYEKTGFFFKLIEVMSEPAAWFMFWEGLDKVFIYSRDKKPNFEFYKKMAHSSIIFASH
ncbi:MAG: hypothetical protein WC438_03640 [Candidatus Pacearchaeota archaeon]